LFFFFGSDLVPVATRIPSSSPFLWVSLLHLFFFPLFVAQGFLLSRKFFFFFSSVITFPYLRPPTVNPLGGPPLSFYSFSTRLTPGTWPTPSRTSTFFSADRSTNPYEFRPKFPRATRKRALGVYARSGRRARRPTIFLISRAFIILFYVAAALTLKRLSAPCFFFLVEIYG